MRVYNLLPVKSKIFLKKTIAYFILLFLILLLAIWFVVFRKSPQPIMPKQVMIKKLIAKAVSQETLNIPKTPCKLIIADNIPFAKMHLVGLLSDSYKKITLWLAESGKIYYVGLYDFFSQQKIYLLNIADNNITIEQENKKQIIYLKSSQENEKYSS